ncbi:MAG: hypothetical protein IPM46_04315 [Flavobacteriales bacterium]|nr:hypothetical protein [Flavobacteriales bacterium]
MTAAEDSPGENGGLYPAFRRLRGALHYYRIDGPDRFTEVQVVGSKRVVHQVKALIYPELVRIQDMLHGSGGLFERIGEQEWTAALESE